MASSRTPLPLTPPPYCQYADGPCDQTFYSPPTRPSTLFFYPDDPEPIATTIRNALSKLRATKPDITWQSWEDIKPTGQIIFCEVCKNARISTTLYADVTTLNFNLLFEIGFALALGRPVVPIRDATFLSDKRTFQELGILDTLGYIDFQNADDLSSEIIDRWPVHPLQYPNAPPKTDTPIYLVKGPHDTEGQAQLLATLKKSRIRFRTYDPLETLRLSLFHFAREVASSFALVANLLHPDRQGAIRHNALSAFLAGMAMAHEKVVLLLQEGGDVTQPIDYRDVVLPYSNPNRIPTLVEPFLNRTIESLQETSTLTLGRSPHSLLTDLDLGDVAAENEILGLRTYFLATGPFEQAKRGHARLVTGRKGAGKTAIFYAVRDAHYSAHSLILDLRPESHHFLSLREFIEDRLSSALQHHTLIAFWHYILLTEIARAILKSDESLAKRDPNRFSQFEELRQVYEHHDPGWGTDFSQRIRRQISRIIDGLDTTAEDQLDDAITEIVYAGDIRRLSDAVVSYLALKDEAWLLIDNLDKAWPIRGARETDVLILRCLLDAIRRLSHDLASHDVDFHSLTFIRSDIHEHLLRFTPDKGKDTAIDLDWSDPAALRELVRLRICSSSDLDGPFDEVWRSVAVPLVGTQDSFDYILERTLMRPRDLLYFLRRVLDFAINRSHDRVQEEDILAAEKAASEDLLWSMAFEMADSDPVFEDVLYAFQSSEAVMGGDDAQIRLMYAGVPEDEAGKVIEVLLWYGFLGVRAETFDETKYSYDVGGEPETSYIPP